MATEKTTMLNYHKTFPKVNYPAETHSETYKGRQYKLSSCKNSPDSFNLGVYSLFPLLNNNNSSSSSRNNDNNYLAPIDPFSLFTLLAILNKQNLKFPQINDELTENASLKNYNSVSILSYHASIDDQLPILIEDWKDKSTHKIVRKIQSLNVINALNSSKLSLNDQLIYNLLNSQLSDFFHLQLLKLNDTKLLKYYSTTNFNFSSNITPINHLLSYNLKLSLLKRNNFNLRNSNIYNYFTSSYPDKLLPKFLKLAFQNDSISLLENANSLLNLLNETLQNSKYWSSNESPNILDFQIASYIYAMNYLSSEIPIFNQLLAKYKSLISHSDSIISLFL